MWLTGNSTEPSDNGLREKHVEWASPDSHHLTEGQTRTNFSRSPDVLSILAALPSFSVKQQSASGLRNSEEMQRLDKAADNQLSPEDPDKRCKLLQEASDDSANDGAAHRRHN